MPWPENTGLLIMGIDDKTGKMEPRQVRKKGFLGSKPGNLSQLVFAGWLLLGILSGLQKISGIEFLPSAAWASKSFSAGIAAGLATALVVLWVAPHYADKAGGKMKGMLAVFLFSLLGFIFGRNALVIAVPMFLGLIAGDRMELSFVVDRADGHDERGCRSPVELQDLPFFFNRLCRVSDNVRDNLAPGQRIIVTGRGTSFGLFADSVLLH